MNKTILTALAIAVLPCLLWYGCGDKEEENAKGSIYGVITDKTTGEPMRASGVELYTQTDDGLYGFDLLTKAVTGNEGQYEFTDLKPGSYFLFVTVAGYEDVQYPVTVEAGKTSRLDMQLEGVQTGLTVRTLNTTGIGGNSATLNGASSNAYSSDAPVECGFVYATQSNPANGGTKIAAASTSGTAYEKTFNATISNLAQGTYYVQAYARNSQGTTYGEVSSFRITGMPAVETLAAANVTTNAATLNGRIVFPGDPAFTERGFVYSNTFQNPTIEDDASATTKRVVSGTGTDFSANVAALTAETTYYVRAYATNSSGTVYGETISFKPTAVVDYVVLESDGIMVQKNDISAGANWNAAKSLCESSTAGGKIGWWMPTDGELTSLYNQRNVVGGFSSNTSSGSFYWSSTKTSYSSLETYHYATSFYNGFKASYNDSNSYYTSTHRVRCVRTLP